MTGTGREAMSDEFEYRDYCAEALDVLNECSTPQEARRALWEAGLHVGRRPPDAIGDDWQVGLLQALDASEDEESTFVVVCLHSLSMALLEDARNREASR